MLAVLIGAAKAALVVLWFTHMIEHRVSSRVVLAVAVALAPSLFAFTLLDVESREGGEPTATPAPAEGARP